MTENQDKHAASSGDSTEIASSHNNNAQGQSTTAGGDGNNIKPKDKKNDSETTVALADTQHEGEKDKAPHDRCAHKDEFGTQRVYKKTSPNCVLTLYLPSREITLSGNNPAILRGIIYVDPKAIQGYRVYAQLTLTFRYGREDEEVMGLRFCNEAIMSLHQVWPRNEEPAREPLSPLQEALVKRPCDGALPFTLTLTPQAPPSVQLVPAKRYYGAPFGTSYDVRCFIVRLYYYCRRHRRTTQCLAWWRRLYGRRFDWRQCSVCAQRRRRWTTGCGGQAIPPAERTCRLAGEPR